MKKQIKSTVLALLGVVAAIAASDARAELNFSWDPFVHSVIISPAPMLPVQFNGTGVATLKPGNYGGSILPLGNPDGNNSNDLMTVTISFANGVPNVEDPSDPELALTAIGGPGKDYWTWTYMPAIATFRGVQRLPIPPYTAEEVTIQYKVTDNAFRVADPLAFNGLNVNIQPPGYTNPQSQDNDQASSFTYVEAIDFGDAPASYGAAQHMIDFTKDVDGFFQKYMYLGSAVDPESAYTASSDARGDDSDKTGGLNVDDEDGVTFPALIPGATVSIPVTMTIVDGDQTGYSGRLSAWFDWNGDGDFNDAGERVATNMLVDSDVLGGATGTVNLNVTVPATATTGLTFARFRFGPSLVGTSEPLPPYKSATYGEVEDYPIIIQSVAQIGDRVWNDLNHDGKQDAGEPNFTNVTVSLYKVEVAGEVTTTNLVASAATDSNGLYGFTASAGSNYLLRVDAPDGYAFSPKQASGATAETDSDFGIKHPFSALFTVVPGGNRLDFDAGLYYAPMLSVITSFRAYAEGGGVFVAWEVAAEYNTIGYWIDRLQDGVWMRLNPEEPVWSEMTGAAASYRLADPGAAPGGTYTWRVVEIEGSGVENVYGPYTVAVDGAAADYDAWAEGIAWNGAAAGRDDDPDGDGLSNVEEFLAGTDPLNANSVLKITGIRPVVNGIEIRWASVAGKVYTVEHARTLGGAWLPVKMGLVAEGAETRFVLPGAEGGFFRIVLEAE